MNLIVTVLTSAALTAALGLGVRAEEAPPFDLTGTWAVMEVTSDIVVYPFVGQRTRTTTLILLLEMRQSGRDVLIRARHCLADIDDGTGLVVTEITDAFLRSLGVVERAASLELVGGNWRFGLDWGTTVHGARLADPVRDPLPTSPDDPRVVDQDGDGKPGITVPLRILGLISGEVYAVQRLWKLLAGTVVSSDLVRGLISWTNEQVAIGASNPFLKTDAQAQVDPVRERSYFVALRIPPGTTCEDLKRTWRALFGR